MPKAPKAWKLPKEIHLTNRQFKITVMCLFAIEIAWGLMLCELLKN